MRILSERIVSLQILRFVAAAMVVLMHAAHLARLAALGKGFETAAFPPADIGGAGVDIFFVISGFVIALTGPLAARPMTGKLFIWRRWSRVAPLYFLLSMPILIFVTLHGEFSFARAVATFLFWPGWGNAFVSPYLDVGWTLCFEMVFYLAVSLTMVGSDWRRNSWLAILVIAGLAIAGMMSDLLVWRILACPIFLEFGLGMCLAAIWPWLRATDLRMGWVLAGTAMVIFTVEAVVGVGRETSWDVPIQPMVGLFRVLVLGMPASALVAGMLILDRSLRGPVVEWLGHLGDASYSIYLCQVFCLLPIGVMTAKVSGMDQTAALTLAMTVGTIAIGRVVFRTVEQPMQRFIRGRPTEDGASISR